MPKKAKAEIKEQDFASFDSGCPYYFGYLAQRKKGEGIPEECLTCEKAVECMLSETKTASPEPKAEKVQLSEETALKEIEEQAFEESEKAVEEKPKHETEIPPEIKAQPSENQFKVENLGMLYATWTNTVRIPKEILSRWGKKVKEVEIETADGKKMRCKVAAIEGSKGNTVEVPDTMQNKLGITKGDFVKVKPCM